MNGNNRTLEQGEKEIETMRSSIAVVRKNARIAFQNSSPINLMQLDVAMMFALPLMRSDLKNDDVPKICDLFNQVMEDFARGRNRDLLPANEHKIMVINLINYT